MKSMFSVNAALSITVLKLISRVNLASFIIMLPKLSKYNTFSSCFWSNVICTVDGGLEILGTLSLTVLIHVFTQTCPMSFFFILHYDQQTHNYFTNYHTSTYFDTTVSSAESL